MSVHDPKNSRGGRGPRLQIEQPTDSSESSLVSRRGTGTGRFPEGGAVARGSRHVYLPGGHQLPTAEQAPPRQPRRPHIHPLLQPRASRDDATTAVADEAGAPASRPPHATLPRSDPFICIAMHFQPPNLQSSAGVCMRSRFLRARADRNSVRHLQSGGRKKRESETPTRSGAPTSFPRDRAPG